MAIGKQSDFVIYQDEFHAGVTEVMQQEADVFNTQSAGAITLETQFHKGNYSSESFFKELSGLTSRRDTTSVAVVTDIAMTMGQDVGVKLDRKIGPVAQTLDSFRKIDADPRVMSYILGTQWAKAIMVEQLNSGLAAGVTAFGKDLYVGTGTTGNTGVVGTVPAATDTMTHSALTRGLGAYGDASQRVRAFVMHSKVYFDLMRQAIADNVYNVAGVTIYQGTVASLNRPVIVSDSASLISVGTGTGGIDEYFTLALTGNAINLRESEGRQIHSSIVDGLENLVMRFQGEYAYTVGIKGYSWDIANGGANPSSATLTTATNWDKNVTDNKSIGGSRILSA